MIGHILENNTYDGKKVVDFFKDKIDVAILMGNIEKAAEISTDVILFNIDNVSDQDTYQNKDSIALAFLKKFNKLDYDGYENIKNLGSVVLPLTLPFFLFLIIFYWFKKKSWYFMYLWYTIKNIYIFRIVFFYFREDFYYGKKQSFRK